MSERMTDERFARFQDWYSTEQCWSNHESELFVALRAERAEVARLTQQMLELADAMDRNDEPGWADMIRANAIIKRVKETRDD